MVCGTRPRGREENHWGPQSGRHGRCGLHSVGVLEEPPGMANQPVRDRSGAVPVILGCQQGIASSETIFSMERGSIVQIVKVVFFRHERPFSEAIERGGTMSLHAINRIITRY